MRSLSQLVRKQALRLLLYPHRLLPGALERNRHLQAFGDGTTFGSLLDRARRLAGAWLGGGLRPGERVLVDLPNSAAFVETRLAAILAGLVAVPIPPATSDRRLEWISEFSEARAYVGPRTGVLPGLHCLHADPLAGDLEPYRRAASLGAPLRRSPRIAGTDLVTINFTSGTTGKPKGVMSTAAGWGWSLYYSMLENRIPFGPEDVILHAVPLATAGSSLILPAVLSGAKSLFLPAWSAGEAARLVEEQRVTRLFLTPTMLAEFVDEARSLRCNLSTLRSVIYGTEGIPVARIAKAAKVLGPILQQGYGMAEALPPVCLLQAEEHARALRQGDGAVLSSVGRPTRAVDLEISDAAGQRLPRGEPGSILVKGKTLSPGYWKREDLTRASRRAGYYVSGDVGYLDGRGYLHVLGREGAVPSETARRLVEWAEARADVLLAWTDEGPSACSLHVVPARGSAMDGEVLAREAAGAFPGAGCLRLTAHAAPPMTESYKLRFQREPSRDGICCAQGEPGREGCHELAH